MKGVIVGMADTFTGETLRFLRQTWRHPVGAGVQTVGIGDYRSEPRAREAVQAALRRAQAVVANVKENMKLYRAEHSWLHAFTAFRLPSPLSATEAGAAEAKTEAEACLRRICREASLSEKQGIAQLQQLLRTAELKKRQGCTTREAWGRASAVWPEFEIGRRLVELFLVWKTSSGNLERRFRRFSEVHCPQRARMLAISVEECALVDQAPPTNLLREWLQQLGQTEPGEPRSAASRWHGHVLRLHESLHARTAERRPRGERRDKGIARELRPDTEAGFGRKRAAAIDAIVAASPSQRARILAGAAPDLAPLAREAAQASGADPVGAAATVVASVAKREGKARERYLGGAKAAAKARSTREKKVLRSATPGPAGRDAYLATARPPRPHARSLGRPGSPPQGAALAFPVGSRPSGLPGPPGQAGQKGSAEEWTRSLGCDSRHRDRLRHCRPDCSSVHWSFLHNAH